MASRKTPQGKLSKKPLPRKRSTNTGAKPPSRGAKKTATAEKAPRKARGTGTKQERLIALLGQAEGATVAEIMAATGWQPHTVRGAISGALKKRLGLTVASEKVEGRGRVYRIQR